MDTFDIWEVLREDDTMNNALEQKSRDDVGEMRKEEMGHKYRNDINHGVPRDLRDISIERDPNGFDLEDLESHSRMVTRAVTGPSVTHAFANYGFDLNMSHDQKLSFDDHISADRIEALMNNKSPEFRAERLSELREGMPIGLELEDGSKAVAYWGPAAKGLDEEETREAGIFSLYKMTS